MYLILDDLVKVIITVMEKGDYPLLFLFTAMESMVFPIPSEAILPPIGFLLADPNSFVYSWEIVIPVVVGATLFGSLASYWMGKYGGKPLVSKWGKWLLLDEQKLAWAEKFYAKHGGITILICRFIPVIRHFSSIPAGVANMNIWKFIIYTAIGGGIWNMFLIWMAYKFSEDFKAMLVDSSTGIQLVKYFIVGLIGLLGLYYVYKIYRAFRKA